MNTVFPAEWHRQSFVQLAFPHADTDWAYMLDEARSCFCEIINAILRFENVLAVCADEESELILKNKTTKNNYQLSIVNCQLNDTWARDNGGITVFNDGKPVILDFTFNAWGLKFAADKDNLLTHKLFENGFFPKEYGYKDCRHFILEGGSIESDGEGTVLTTEKCLLSENRNYLSKAEIEQKFAEFFGTERVLWLSHGALAGDDTDSHIDTLVRFVSADTITYIKCKNANDEHFTELDLMEKELQNLRQKNGKPYNLLPLPMVDAVFDENDKRIPATYANFLIINDAILLPTYCSPKDEKAKNVLQTAFPDRKIIGINCLPLIKQHGSLHCVTMQFPIITN